MLSRSRVLLLVSCLAAPGCFGGPTNEWPAKGSSDTETSGPGGLDAGKKPATIDAGVADSPSTGKPPCSGAADAGVPMDAAGSPRSDASLPDAGCR